MSKKTLKAKAKMLKKEKLLKKAKRKRIKLLIVCILAVLVISGLVIYSVNESKNSELYSNHGQSVRLFHDGRFSAILAHSVRKKGTYTKTTEAERIIVSFNINDNIETGWIVNDNLHLPGEWDDGHGHGNVLRKR